MRRRSGLALAAGLLALAACEDLPFAPRWNADIVFPIRYPDVVIPTVAGGGFIPPTNVSFTAPVDSQVVNSTTREIFDQDIDSLKAEVLFSTTTNITGSMDLSVSPVRANLFTSNPALAVTVTMPIRVTAGDTSRVTVNTTLFRTAQVLYVQTRGTMRSNTGGVIAVGPNDKLVLGVDLTATVKISQ